MGRPAKITELKIAGGEKRKCRLPAREYKNGPKDSSPPNFFNAEEKQIWKVIVSVLKTQGREIRAEEKHSFVNFVVLQSQVYQLRRELDTLVEVVSQGFPSPEIAWASADEKLYTRRRMIAQLIAHTAIDAKKLASEIGLTPAARSRGGWGKDELGAQEQDPWNGFVNGG